MGTLWCSMGRRGAAAAIVVAAVLCACAPVSRGTVQAERSRAVPVLDVDFADPFVLPVGDTLFAYATNTHRGGRRINIQLSRSHDGRSWSFPREAMPVLPAWVLPSRPDIWAPEAMRVGQTYVLYFSARHATRLRPDGRTLCVGAAVASAPEGPFVPQPAPLTCGGAYGVIDASPFRDGHALWLYVKTDGNCCDAPTRVQALPLTADGLALAGEALALGGLGADRAWEGQVVEAPHMIRADGRYFMFYAGNDYGGAHYATGYAVCDAPTGPCVDAPENPVLRSDTAGAIGPGHPAVFRHAGRIWIAYHGWRPGRPTDERAARYRAMYIARLDWVGGRPVAVRP